jgi:hypothetical protein
MRRRTVFVTNAMKTVMVLLHLKSIHICGYEGFYLVGYNAIYFVGSQQRFRSNMSQFAACFHAAFLLGSFFDPEHERDMFLRTDHTALYPKR